MPNRKAKDKKMWKGYFNLGSEMRGNTRKAKRRITLTDNQFKRSVKSMTQVQAITIAHRCNECKGTGRVARKRKDGTFFCGSHMKKLTNGMIGDDGACFNKKKGKRPVALNLNDTYYVYMGL